MKTLKITTHWTTQEAAEIYETLDLLKTAIWESYGNDIKEMYISIEDEQQASGAPFNDAIDF